MLNKTFALLAALVLSSAAWAQTTTKSNDFVSFDNIEVNNDFEVTFHKADFYRVDWTFDTILSDVVGVHVSGRTLHISLNKKGMSSELKKTYKGRNAPKPILKVTVYAPHFSGLTLSENAVFEAAGNRISTGTFQMTLSDKARVNNLVVDADRATIDLEKGGNASLTVNAGQVTVKTDKSSSLNLLQTSESLSVSTAGSSSVTVSGQTESLITSCQNSSKISVSGKAQSVLHNGKGSSETDLLNLPLKTADVTMANSSKLFLSVSESLRVDLKGGSTVTFSGEPRIDVVNIVSSSLLRYTGKKK